MVTIRTVQNAYERFVSIANDFRKRFLTPLPDVDPYSMTCPPVHDDSKEFLVILLQNEWGTFCQDLLELSIHGNGPTLAGTVLTPITIPDDISSIDSYFKKMRTKIAQEMPNPLQYPVWHNPDYVIRLSGELKPQNHETILTGLGSSIEAKNINVVRNYIVHGAKPDYERLLNRLGARGSSVSTLLSLRVTPTSTIFEDWVEDLVTAAKNAAN